MKDGLYMRKQGIARDKDRARGFLPISVDIAKKNFKRLQSVCPVLYCKFGSNEKFDPPNQKKKNYRRYTIDSLGGDQGIEAGLPIDRTFLNQSTSYAGYA